MKQMGGAAAEARQARVSKAVWGLLLLSLGLLFLLNEAGAIQLLSPDPLRAEMAVDGDPQTRWGSRWSDTQSITVDLGSVVSLTRVRLLWEKAYATAYRLEAATDGSTFTTLREVTDGDGDVDEIDVDATVRYLRLTGTKRATKYGYSLWEIEAYGPSGRYPPAGGVSASSTESLPLWPRFWFRYWPLLLLAFGLPPLLAPKDGGDQLLGLSLVTAGAFFQLQRLELVRWTFAQAWPLLLVLAGAHLVVEALRHSAVRPPPRGPGPAKPQEPNASAG